MRAHAVLTARATIGSDRVLLGWRLRTVDQVWALCSTLAVVVQGGPHPAPAGRPLRFAGRGLAVVNTAAAAVVLGQLAGVPPVTWLSAALAVVVCGVQVGLAFDLGRRMRPFLGASLPLPVVIEFGLLVALSGLVAAACDRWAHLIDGGTVGVAAGLVLAASALAAPLMIVSDELYGPGAVTRTLHRAERALERVDRRCRVLDRRGRRHLDAANRRLWQAEQMLVLVIDAVGAADPNACELQADIEGLRAEIRAVWREYTMAVPPLDPDDLDLVG
jgi:hypothetical protein